MTHETIEKEQILTEYAHLITWVERLKHQRDDKWLKPMAEGKWSIGETIAHLLFWDRFIHQERLPFIEPGVRLPKSSINVDEVNKKAAEDARTVISKGELIEQFILTRSSILSFLVACSEELFYTSFSINTTELTLASFIKGMVEHDNLHLKQMEAFIKSHS